MDTKSKDINVKIKFQKVILPIIIIVLTIYSAFLLSKIENLTYATNKHNVYVMDEAGDSKKYSDEVAYMADFINLKLDYSINNIDNVEEFELLLEQIYNEVMLDEKFYMFQEDYEISIYFNDKFYIFGESEFESLNHLFHVDGPYHSVLGNTHYVNTSFYLTTDAYEVYDDNYDMYIKEYTEQVMQVATIAGVTFLLLIIYTLLEFILPNKQDIKLNLFDKIYFELQLMPFFILLYIIEYAGIYSLVAFIRETEFNTNNIMIIASVLILAYCYYFIISNIKRIKVGKFFEHVLIIIIIRRILKNISNVIIINYTNNKKFLVLKITLVILFMIMLYISSLFSYSLSTFIIFTLPSTIAFIICFKLLQRSEQVTKIIDKVVKFEEFDVNDYKKLFPYNETVNVLSNLEKYMLDIVDEKLVSERTKTELITNMSHDLRTPLTAIISYIELLKKNEDRNKEETEYIEILEAKANRLNVMIDSLFDLSRVTSGEKELEFEEIDFSKLIEQTLYDLDINNDNVVLKLEPKLLINANGDTMYEVLQNLIVNANKYHLSNTRIFISSYSSSDKVIFEISNISSYEINFTADEIINRFYRGDESRTGDGNGLGLSIAMAYAEANNGEFNVILDGDMFKVRMEFKCSNN